MPRNGSGTYTPPANTKGTAGTTIESSKYNTFIDDNSGAHSGAIAKDGQTPYTGNQPMGGNTHTNVGNATLRTNYPAVGQVQDGDFSWAGTVGGSANVLTATLTPAITTYKNGMLCRFEAASANTGAATININSLGAVAIVRDNDVALLGNEIKAGAHYTVSYDSSLSKCILQNPTEFISGLTSAADKAPYWTGAGVAALMTVTSFIRTLLDDTTATAARTTLGAASAATVAGLPFTSIAESGQFGVTAGSLITYAHGLGSVPQLMQVRAICLSADGGYAVNDLILLNHSVGDRAGSSNSIGIQVRFNASNIYVQIGATHFHNSLNKSGGAVVTLDDAKWGLFIKAWV